MTKKQLLAPYERNPALRLTLARVLDQQALAAEKGIPAFTAFLTPEEQAEAASLLARLPGASFCLFGGYEEAERKICAFLPDWWSEAQLFGEQSPLCALEISVPPMAQLGHRDYLGSLMGLGISREKFGDILPLEQGAQLILLRELLPIVESQWESVGRYPLTLRPLPLGRLEKPPLSVRKVEDTLASLRLDSLIASGFSLSRSRAAELIAAGRVFRNHRPCEKADQEVLEGDVFSCRGMGKFVLKRIGGKSKKGRIRIELDRYE